MSKLLITKQPDDPICPRVSIGGTPDTGYYAQHRGELSTCWRIVAIALEGMMRNAGEDPEKLMELGFGQFLK